MSEQPSGEKTFEPTEKRKKDAIEKGNVLRSKEVATAVSVLVGAIWLKLAGPWLMATVESSAESSWSFDRSTIVDFQPGQMMQDLIGSLVPPILTLGLLVVAATLTAQLTLGGGAWVNANLTPKPSRLDPIAGLKRMFGPQGWIELGKGLAKLALLGSIAWFWSTKNLVAVMQLGRGELTGQLSAAWGTIANLLLLLSGGLVVIAMIDWPIQYARRNAQLRMTNQEVRDEHKQQDGSPEKKAAIRQRQRDLSKGGLRPAMKDAQLILTNPTHFSVALAYDPVRATAPYVLAKGRAEKALAMRELAAEMDVPVLEYPTLARAVYFTTREQQMIRVELYSAIASILAFVMSLKRGESPRRPQVVVPLELHFDAEGRAWGSSPAP